jgi:hypothetical protein
MIETIGYTRSVATDLDFPPLITSPRFIIKALKASTIVLENTLSIPHKMWGKKGVVKQVKSPVP